MADGDDGVPVSVAGIRGAAMIFDVSIFEEKLRATATHLGEVVDDWLAVPMSNHRPRLVGFDIEPIIDGDNAIPADYAISLCMDNRCLVYFVPMSTEIFPSRYLKSFFSDKYNKFVSDNTKQKLDHLQMLFGMGGDAEYMDLLDHLGPNMKDLHDLFVHVYHKDDVQFLTDDPEELTAYTHRICLDDFLRCDMGCKLHPDHA